MDVDRPLDEMIADKRKANQSNKPVSRGGGAGGRQSRDRRDAVPYARPPPRSTEDKWVHDAFQDPAGNTRRAGGGNIAAVAGTAAGFTGISPRIEVVGLHYEVTPADLKNIFSQAGTLVQGPTIRARVSYTMQYDRSGRSTGQATMEYASPQQAKIAINKFDGAMTKGQTISIRLLPPVQARPAPGAGPAVAGNNQAQTGASLLARLGKANGMPAGGAGGSVRGGVARGGGAVRGGGATRGRGAPAARGGGARKAPANAGDLDKELDSFMKDGPADVAMS